MATRTNQETRTNQADQATRNGEVTYQIKAINYGGENKMIILPNENGSSPLIAICTRNLLILRNGMDLTPDRCEVTQQRLIDLLAFRLFMIEDDKEDHFENKAQNIMDAMELLPRLAAGIDVNVKFRSIDDFELSPELTIFGLLKIPLYHGWIFDPQDNETATAVGFKSYNDLMMAGLVTLAEKSPIGQGCGESSVDFTATPTRTPTSAEHSRLGRGGDSQEHNAYLRTLRLSAVNNSDWDSTSSSRDSQDSSSGGTSSSGYSVDLMDTGSGCTSPPGKGNLKSRCDDQISSKESRDGAVIKKFLNTNASQLTFPGLFSLRETLKEGDLCVFLRNTHFYTMLKNDNALYTLVTDQGYMVWKNLIQEYIDIINSLSKEGTEGTEIE
uniref:MINDY deubiquitinase domain-containing protein n=1 Tax=Brassica campestris TaxID=3711 RepID=A0A3P6AGQ7_BRACM|nr:unnamed protein product [Brassica rapa]